jgi:hypothetical protein
MRCAVWWNATPDVVALAVVKSGGSIASVRAAPATVAENANLLRMCMNSPSVRVSRTYSTAAAIDKYRSRGNSGEK